MIKNDVSMKKLIKYIILLITLFLFIIIIIKNYNKQKGLNILHKVIEIENLVEINIIEPMPKITDIIIGNNNKIALCEDGSVWSWSSKQHHNMESENVPMNPIKVPNLKDIVKIMDMDSAIYALSKDGNIYAWGDNKNLLISIEESRDKVFNEPVILKGLSNIVSMDAKNGTAFAIDRNSKFYMWGLYLYSDEISDIKPGFPQKNNELVEDVKCIFAGAGNYHYFIRNDGTVFSIMESYYDAFKVPYDFIFPEFLSTKDQSENQTNEEIISTNKLDTSVALNEGTKYGLTILCELGVGEGIDKISADEYTMFLYKTDKSLWFWNSNRIKYHDNKRALADPETAQVNYTGYFEEVNFNKLLEEENSYIIDISSGKENTLFLMDNGQIFISEYTTYDVQDVEYYNLANTNPNRNIFTSVEPSMHLKKMTFRKLDLENIISINSDGEYNFTAVDLNGFYHLVELKNSQIEEDNNTETLIRQIRNGDFSNLELSNNISINEIKRVYEKNNIELVECDINGDGLIELIWQEKDSYNNYMRRIIAIFTFSNSKTKCVVWDVNDSTEFLFMSKLDNIIYYTQYYGLYDYNRYDYYVFDKDCNKEFLYGLCIYNIYDIQEINMAWWNEEHPEMTIEGVYYKKHTVRLTGEGKISNEEELEKKEFLNSFKEMTGIDFYDMKPEWVK